MRLKSIRDTLKQLCSPSAPVYASLLRQCAISKSLPDARSIHDHIVETGHFLHSVHVGNLLIQTYRKCGSLAAARAVFDQMPRRDIVSWGCIIAAYAQSGHSREAIALFRQMDLQPSEMVIVSVLAACSAVRDLELGAAIHARIRDNKDLLESVFVGTALVNMYGKCGDIDRAKETFAKIPHSDVVAWTAMVTAYAQCGHCIQALETVERMIQACVQPNPVTFVVAITACASKELVHRGRAIHAAVIDRGLQHDMTIQNALVSMYAKGGRADEALKIFEKMEQRNRVSWNSMIAAFASAGQCREAMDLFHRMSLNGIKPDDVSFLGVLSACSGRGCIRLCQIIHSILEIHALEHVVDLSVENALLTAYAKCGHLLAAERLFDKISGKNVVSWTAMLTAYTFHGDGRKALELYETMIQQSIELDGVALLNVVYAGALVGDRILARKIHSSVSCSNAGGGIQIQNALINMYSRCGSLVDARRVFDSIQRKNLVSWNAMMGSYLQHGDDDEVIALFQELKSSSSSLRSSDRSMLDSNTVDSRSSTMNPKLDSTNSTNFATSQSISDSISACSKTDLQPDCIMAVILVSAYAGLGELAEARRIHAELCESSPDVLDGMTSNVTLGNALITMYARCGSLDEASATFLSMKIRDTVSWSSLVAGYAHHGHRDGTAHVYRGMHHDGVPPDSITYVSILNSCSHGGLVDQAGLFFRSMIEDYNLDPWPDHWKCMVDALGRAGFVTEAEDLVNNMPFHPDLVAWNTLLGCCKVHGDLERAAVAASNAAGINPEFAGSVLLLFNLYAEIEKVGGTV